jgi:hypothetical protein
MEFIGSPGIIFRIPNRMTEMTNTTGINIIIRLIKYLKINFLTYLFVIFVNFTGIFSKSGEYYLPRHAFSF